MSEPLWTLDAMAAAMSAARAGALPRDVAGLSIDTPHASRRATRSSPSRARAATATISSRPRCKAGAGLAVVARGKRAAMPQDAPLLVVADVLAALERPRAGVARALGARRSSPSPARSARPAPRRRCASRSAGRARRTRRSPPTTITGACRCRSRGCRASAQFGVFEIGMNHAGEITPLTQLVRPHVAIVTTIAPVHLEFFGTLEAIADAKAEIFSGLEPGGAAVLNRDNRAVRAAARTPRAAAGIARDRRRSASTQAPTRGCCKLSLQAETSTVQARILGDDVTYKLGAPGRHRGRELARRARGGVACSAPISRSRRSRSPSCKPPAGRGERVTLDVPGGSALLIDESYNANPTSMRAALALLGQAPVGTARPAHRGARRHAGARRRRRRAACAASRDAVQRQRDRSRLLRRPADEIAVGRASLRAPGRLCRDLRGARAAGPRRDPRRRCHHGQGLARLAHGPDRQGAQAPLRAAPKPAPVQG